MIKTKKRKLNSDEIDQTVNQQKIEAFYTSLTRSEDASVQLFDQLNTSERLICGQSYKAKEGDVYFLHIALQQGHDCKLVHRLRKVTDANITRNAETLLAYLFDRKSRHKRRHQKKILEYLLQFFRGSKIDYRSILILHKAMRLGSDEAACTFLNEYLKVDPTITPSLLESLLNEACNGSGNLRCIVKLVLLGAILNEEHARFFNNRFGFRRADNISDNDLREIINLFKNKNIQIPVLDDYFTAYRAQKRKELLNQEKRVLLVSLAFENCDAKTWLKLEETIVSTCTIGAHPIGFTQIQRLFEVNPNAKITEPNKFEFIAVKAIRAQHPLIYTLLDRGLSLNHVFNTPSVWPEDANFSNPAHNTVADFVAFYSTDPVLLFRLQNVISTNELGRTPAHYAALAMPNMHKKNNHKVHHPGPVEWYLSYLKKIFNPENTLPCLDSIGSPTAFVNANLAQNFTKTDFLGFMPYEYVLMNTNEDQRKIMIEKMYEILNDHLIPQLNSLLPLVLSKIVLEYLIFPLQNSNDLTKVLYQTLLSSKTRLGPILNCLVFQPLKNFLLSDNEIVNEEVKFTLVRIGLQIFNLLTILCGATVLNLNVLIKAAFQPIVSQPLHYHNHPMVLLRRPQNSNASREAIKQENRCHRRTF